VRHLPGVLDQALHGAQALAEREQLGGGRYAQGSFATRAQREADHASEVAHLLGGSPMPGVIGQLWIEHSLDGRMADQHIDDRARVGAMTFHTHCQRLCTAQCEIAIERCRHRTGRVLREAQPFCDVVVVNGNEAADNIAVAAEVLRRRVNHDVGTKRERLLQIRRRKRVVYYYSRTALVRQRTDRFDVEAAQQRVGRRLEPHQLGVFRPSISKCVDTEQVGGSPRQVCVYLADQSIRAAVRIVPQQHTIASLKQAQDVVFRGEATGKGKSVGCSLERCDLCLVCGARRVAATAVLEALVLADAILCERRTEADRRHDCTSSRIWFLARMNRTRVEAPRVVGFHLTHRY
jgi:hypothetical protein